MANTTSVPTSFRPIQQQVSSLSQWSTTITTAATNPTPVRFFATAPGGGGTTTGDDDNEKNSSNDDVIPPPVIDLESHSNADPYDPYEITKSFEDTSYYYPPAEETDPKFLASKFEGMTNEELLDSSSIAAPIPDSINNNHTWDSLMHSPPIRDKAATLPKGTLVGTVVSTKMQKTVNVAVDRYKIHPKYRKRIRYTRKFMAHDENEVASDGDLVLIVPSQRISKNKHFVLQEILKAKGQL
jgi:small subunit ribosomal protein S17